MQRLPNNSLKNLRSAIPKKYRGTISVQLLSDYISGNKRPGIERSIILESACKKCGLSVSAPDWVYNPQKIKAALANNNNPPKTKEETA